MLIRSLFRRFGPLVVLSLVATFGDDVDAGPAVTTQPTASGTDISTGDADASSASAEWEAIVAAAEEEGSVMLYYTNPGLAETLEPAFEAAYDIDLQFFRAVGGDLTTRAEEERRSGAVGADVLVVNDRPYLSSLDESGDLLEPAGPMVELWEGSDYFFGFGFEAYVTPIVTGWNTNLFPEGIGSGSSYEDVLDLDAESIGYQGINADTYRGLFGWLDETYPGFLESFAALEPRPYESGAQLAQGLAAGEVAVALNTTPKLVIDARDAGAPVEYVVHDETFATSATAVALGWSQRPNAALVLLDFMMSTEGQVLINEDGNISPLPEARAEDPSLVAPDVVAKVYDPGEWSASRRSEFDTRFAQLFGG